MAKNAEIKDYEIRTVPHDIQLEKEILGAILIEPEAIGKAIEIIDEHAFYLDAHRKIYSSMLNLFHRNEPVDVATLAQEMMTKKSKTRKKEEKNWLELAGGVGYLAELSTAIPSAANVEAHLKILKDLYLYRSVITTCNELGSMAYNREIRARELLDEAESKFFNIAQETITEGYRNINPIIHNVMEEYEKIQQRKTILEGVTGIPSGLEELDRTTAGFQKTDLIIVAGRPGMGKTALALNLIRNVTVKYDVPAAFFSLEMGSNQLVTRLISAESELPMQKIRTGRLSDREFLKLTKKIDKLSQAPLFIDDTPGLNILTLRSRARRLKREANIEMIIVDYLQLMEGPRSESRQIEITMISRALKNLAKELNLPVIALSQLSRAVESRPDKKPQLSDLRESGAIEQDADIVMFVYRPEYYGMTEFPGGNGIDTTNKMQILIEKHRNGPTGSTIVQFQKEIGKIMNLDMMRMPEPSENRTNQG